MAAVVIGVAAFYLDADVHAPMVELLEARRHTALMTRQVTSVNATDDEQLLTATDLGRILISHNKKDYLLLCKAWRSFARRWDVEELHAGVLVVPQPVTVPYARTVSDLHNLVRQQQLWGQYAEYDAKWGWQLGL